MMKAVGMKKCVAGLLALLGCCAAPSLATAGNVSARVSGGSLYVYGDRFDNTIVIESLSAGNISVTGLTSGSGEPTTINGGNTPADLTGWTNGIFVYLYEGNDSVSLLSGNVNGATHIDLGPGNDDAILGSELPTEMSPSMMEEVLNGSPLAVEALASALTLQQSLVVIGVAGDDFVSLANAYVRGRTTLDLGLGNDEVYVGAFGEDISTTFGDYVVIVPGPGTDATFLGGVSVARDLTIDDPTDAADVGLTNVEVNQNLFIFTSLASDNITLTDVLVSSLVKILAKDGVDDVSITNLVADRMELFLGNGDDTFVGTGIGLNRLWSYLEGGNDVFNLASSYVGTHFLYASSGNDNMTITGSSGNEATIYGDGGNDTLTTTGNSIPTVRVYTVENRL